MEDHIPTLIPPTTPFGEEKFEPTPRRSPRVSEASSLSESSEDSVTPLEGFDRVNVNAAIAIFGRKYVAKLILKEGPAMLKAFNAEKPRKKSSSSSSVERVKAPPVEAKPAPPERLFVPVHAPTVAAPNLQQYEIDYQDAAERAYAAGIRSATKKFQEMLSPENRAKETFELNTAMFGRNASKRDSEDSSGKKASKAAKVKSKKKLVDSSSDKDLDEDEEVSDSSDISATEKKPRTSMLLPGLSDRGVKIKPKTGDPGVKIYAEQHSFAHIRLKDLTLDSIFNFWSEYNRYKEMHGIELKAAALIENGPRREIMARCDIPTDAIFYALDTPSIAQYIQKTVKPTDKKMFSQMLSQSLAQGGGDINVSVIGYRALYTRLLQIRREFVEKYEFLAFENSERVPKLENKEFGLIYIFLNALPTEYGKAVFANLPNSRFSSLKKFLHVFFKTARAHYKVSLTSQELSSFLSYKSSSHSKRSEAAKREDDTRVVEKPKWTKWKPSRQHLRKIELQHDHGYDSEDSRSFMFYDSDFDKYDSDRVEYEFRTPTPKPEDFLDYVPPDVKESKREPESRAELNAFGGGTFKAPQRPAPKPSAPIAPATKPADRGPQGCFRAITEGKCNKPGCTFDHSMAALEATREDMLKKLNKRPYAAASRPVNAVLPDGSKTEPTSSTSKP